MREGWCKPVGPGPARAGSPEAGAAVPLLQYSLTPRPVTPSLNRHARADRRRARRQHAPIPNGRCPGKDDPEPAYPSHDSDGPPGPASAAQGSRRMQRAASLGPASPGRPVVFGPGRGRMSGVQDPRHCLQALFTSSRLAGGAQARPARCLAGRVRLAWRAVLTLDT